MIYICEICKKKWLRKNDYDRHINKKFPCQIIDMTNEETEINKKNEDILLRAKIREYDNIIKNMEKNASIMDEKIKVFENEAKIMNEQIKNQKNEIFKLKKIEEKFKNDEGKHYEKVIPFGNEIYHKILNKNELETLLKKGMKCIYAILEYVHFGKNKQWHNIYLSNIKNTKYLTIFDGTNWITSNAKKIVQELMDNLIYTIDYSTKEMDNIKIDANDKKKVERFLGQLEYDDDLKKDIYDEIILILYNHRNIVTKTRFEKD
jgi:hypothetical protein